MMNSTVLPYFHFGMNHQAVAVVRPTSAAYVNGRKRENSYFWKDRIISPIYTENVERST